MHEENHAGAAERGRRFAREGSRPALGCMDLGRTSLEVVQLALIWAVHGPVKRVQIGPKFRLQKLGPWAQQQEGQK